ncbi:hypothetical protein HPP92_006629 [Vanilla planifolia]|uniref:Uncharacterized protein n=1 Tax=Vanilla planifolia TaxID=51239 RepID=A0A835RIS0_VANPL|nr:hypothetical protein HPP92_006896 [Vanilla planifolia]KAG0489766.1 hypothetical protein HPP92_006629 [Vanilla planifolia]
MPTELIYNERGPNNGEADWANLCDEISGWAKGQKSSDASWELEKGGWDGAQASEAIDGRCSGMAVS